MGGTAKCKFPLFKLSSASQFFFVVFNWPERAVVRFLTRKLLTALKQMAIHTYMYIAARSRSRQLIN